jgi:hypothetical protein
LKQDPWEMVNLVKKEKELVAKLEQEFQALKLSIETDPVNDLR